MTTDELKEKYKSAPLAARFALMAIVGVLVPAYYYTEESKVVEAEVAAQTKKLQEVKRTLIEQKSAKSQIPKKEELLDTTDKKVNDVRRSLPPSFEVHEVLRMAELAAKENDVSLTSFKPETEDKKSLYVEMPFNMIVQGKFVDVTRYVDDLLHFETLTKVADLKYRPQSLMGPMIRTAAVNNANRIQDLKANAGVQLEFKLLVYKSVGL